MEFLILAIDEKRADLEERLGAVGTEKEKQNLSFELKVLDDLSNSHPEYEEIRLCVRDINLTDSVDLGEAYGPEAEAVKIESLADKYRALSLDKGENGINSHSLKAQVIYELLSSIAKNLRVETVR